MITNTSEGSDKRKRMQRSTRTVNHAISTNGRLLIVLLACLLHLANPVEAEPLDNWTPATPPLLPTSGRQIEEGGGQWVAVNHNTIFRSTNGTEWSRISLDLDITLHEAVYGNGRWIARGTRYRPQECSAGTSGDLVLLTSTDGANWEPVAEALLDLLRSARHKLSSGFIYRRLSFGDGRWLALHASGEYLTSMNGIDWSTGNILDTISSETDFYDLAYENGTWVAAGFGFYSLETLVYTSVDGESWTKEEAGSGPLIRNIAFGDGEWLALADGRGEYKQIWASPDTRNWSLRSTISAELAPGIFGGVDLNHLRYEGGHWVIAGTIQTDPSPPWPSDGKVGMILDSPDGILWSQHTFEGIGRLDGVVFIDGRWIATGGTGLWNANTVAEFVVSSTGSDWEPQDDGNPAFTIEKVEHANGLWVAIGTVGAGLPGLPAIASSSNGVSWTVRHIGAKGTNYAIAHGDGRWIAIGGENVSGSPPNPVTLISTDGINWSSHPGGDPYQFSPQSIAYGAGVWLATGFEWVSGPEGWKANNVTATSSDGLIWAKNAAALPVEGPIKIQVRYADGLWVAAGSVTRIYDPESPLAWDKPTIITSPDAVNWTARGTGTEYGNLYSLEHHNGLWVAAGAEPAESPDCWTARALVLTSNDGLTWNRQALSIPHWSRVTSVGFGAGHWVLAGAGAASDASEGYGLVLSSADGSAWEWRQVGYVGRTMTAVTFVEGRFLLSTSSAKATFQSDALLVTSPRLTIAREGHQLLLRIEGQAGSVLHLEKTITLSDPDWAVIETITLMEDFYETVIDPGEERTTFWRIHMP